jgi:hypothetical protein
VVIAALLSTLLRLKLLPQAAGGPPVRWEAAAAGSWIFVLRRQRLVVVRARRPALDALAQGGLGCEGVVRQRPHRGLAGVDSFTYADPCGLGGWGCSAPSQMVVATALATAGSAPSLVWVPQRQHCARVAL